MSRVVVTLTARSGTLWSGAILATVAGPLRCGQLFASCGSLWARLYTWCQGPSPQAKYEHRKLCYEYDALHAHVLQSSRLPLLMKSNGVNNIHFHWHQLGEFGGCFDQDKLT